MNKPKILTGLLMVLLFLAGVVIAKELSTPQPNPQKKTMQFFARLKAADLKQAQVKLTYMGEQRAPILTTVFHASSRASNMDEFAPYRTAPEGNYGNDFLSRINTFAASPQELEAIIKALAPVAQNGSNTSGDNHLSITITRMISGNTEGTEVLLNRNGSMAAAKAILNHLDAGNTKGKEFINLLNANL
jgi:hypothetical protein